VKRILPLMMIALYTLSAAAQSSSVCKVTFGVVTKDDFNNMHQGLSPKTLAWFQKKMQPKHPDLCYSDGAAPVVLFFSSKPAVYHGTRTVSNSGTIHDSTGQQVATTETDQQVAYDVDYDLLYLSIESEQADGTWKVVQNFGGSTLHPTFSGFCIRNCHPANAAIEKALNWLEAGGLTDPTQSVAQ
jgi:hypothetical protein